MYLECNNLPDHRYEITVNGIGRSFYVRKGTAIAAAAFLKARWPEDIVKIIDLRTGRKTLMDDPAPRFGRPIPATANWWPLTEA